MEETQVQAPTAAPAAGAVPSKKTGTHRRFDRTARLIGDRGVQRLADSHIMVVGVGGVGSQAVEALARSGVGKLTLIDFDRICVTNVNRQLHAMKGTLGKGKVDVMAERIRLINPDVDVDVRKTFYNADSAEVLFTPEPDLVIDAIDNLTAKVHLIARCMREKIRLVSSMGAAARLDPTRVEVADLSDTRGCPFAREVRKLLRRHQGIDAKEKTGVMAIFSQEPPIAPVQLAYDLEGFQCVCPGGKNGVNDCEKKHRIEGSAAFVPAAFGLAAASLAVRMLLANTPAE